MLHLLWNTSLPSMKLVVQNINCLWCICEKFPPLFKSTSEISFYQMIYSNMSHNTLWGYYRSLLFPVADTKTICESANSISQNYLCRNGNMISKFNMGIIFAPYFPYYVPKDKYEFLFIYSHSNMVQIWYSSTSSAQIFITILHFLLTRFAQFS